MSMDDPGWGTFVPIPGEPERPAPPPGPPSLPPDHGDTEPPRSRPKRAIVIVVTAVVLVAVVVGLVLARSPGSKAAAPPSSTAPANPTTSPGGSTTGAPTTAAGPLSKADYIAKADNICLAYRPRIQQATANQDLQTLAQVGQLELDELRGLGDPAQDAALLRSSYNDFTQAINFLIQNDITDANPLILSADTKAGQFGLKVCNYGH